MAILSHRTRAILSLASTLYTLTLLLTSHSLRHTLRTLFSPRAHPLRLATLLLTLALNLKSLPLSWHIRLFGPMYYQLFLQPQPLPRDALFRPVITKGCRTSLPETDYNLHKSNSTYFADLDVGRMMLISCLLRRGIRESARYATAEKREVEEAMMGAEKSRGQDGEAGFTGEVRSGEQKGRRKSMSEAAVNGMRKAGEAVSEVAAAETVLRTPHVDADADADAAPTRTSTGGAATDGSTTPVDRSTTSPRGSTTPKEVKKSDRFIIALGGVTCHFKRELKPYEEYEIWTRVLSWDRKWFYLVQHMVKAGAVKPDSYALGLSRSFSERVFGVGRRRGKNGLQGETAGEMNGSLRELRREQKAEWQKHVFASSISKYVVKKGRLTIPPELVWQRSNLLPLDQEERAQGDIEGQVGDEEAPYAWTRKNVEKERARGYELAGHLAALDGLTEEFPTSWGLDEEVDENKRGVGVLGSFQDWLVF